MTDRFVHISGDVGAESIIVKQQRQEIAQLKEAIRRLADQDATLSVQSGNVTVTMDATLTDDEREAIEAAIVGRLELADFATLRKLLERLT
jgi:nitrate reductase NapAB chaperone NapD